MKHFLAVVVVVFSMVGSAYAGLDRTAVSLNGSDTNPCSLQLPCATFAKAISETNPLGELIALDSGGYDGFTVDRGMNITVAPGAVVTIGKEPGTTGWAIKVDAPGKYVAIRGVMVVANGISGIVAHDAARTYIDDVVIEGNGCDNGCGTGIFGRRGALFVHNARIHNVFNGIVHNPLEPSTATITDSIIDGADSTGIRVDNYARATVRNTVVSHTHYAFASGTLEKDGKPSLTLVDCTASDSETGIDIGDGSIVRLERTAVTRNTIGLHNTGGTVITFGNNMVDGNGTDTVGPMTTNVLM
ncbi:MAG TPA: right-handed parallel beta-helix repeat-containing protein [Thermoanaerobaculia bacterium]|jgi:hypothetical protein